MLYIVLSFFNFSCWAHVKGPCRPPCCIAFAFWLLRASFTMCRKLNTEYNSFRVGDCSHIRCCSERKKESRSSRTFLLQRRWVDSQLETTFAKLHQSLLIGACLFLRPIYARCINTHTHAKAYNTCIAPQAAYRSCSGAVHVTDS